MAIVKTLNILLRGKTDKLKSDYRRGETLTKSFAKKIRGINESFTAGGLFKGLAIAGLGAAILREASNAEKAAVSYQVLLGSVEAANATLADLRKFSDATPFTTSQVRAAGKQLLAAGIGADQLVNKMRVLGDVAALTSGDLQRVIAIYAKGVNRGRFELEQLNQLAESGVSMEKLAASLNMSTTELFAMVRAGKFTAAKMDEAFAKMTGAGGVFENGMEKLSETFSGRLSTLISKLAGLAEQVGLAVLPALTSMIETLTAMLGPGTALMALVEQFTAVLVIFVGVVGFVINVIASLNKMLNGALGYFIGIIAATYLAIVVLKQIIKIWRAVALIIRAAATVQAFFISLSGVGLALVAAAAVAATAAYLAMGSAIDDAATKADKLAGNTGKIPKTLPDGLGVPGALAASTGKPVKLNQSSAGFGSKEAFSQLFTVRSNSGQNADDKKLKQGQQQIDVLERIDENIAGLRDQMPGEQGSF